MGILIFMNLGAIWRIPCKKIFRINTHQVTITRNFINHGRKVLMKLMMMKMIKHRSNIQFSDGHIILIIRNHLLQMKILMVINSISQHLIKIPFSMILIVNFLVISNSKNVVGYQINMRMILHLMKLFKNMVLVLI